MSIDCECVVIGAGVVGLAIAARLASDGREVIIIEAESDFGSGTSARNSEVIHAGIYYAKDSLKARYCVQGKHRLYDYCKDRLIPFRQCGKLIVASNQEQLQQLEAIRARAQANGVHDLQLLNCDQAQALEPALTCVGALLSPSTGIVDSHALMTALLADAENAGAVLAKNTRVSDVIFQSAQQAYDVVIDDELASTLRTRIVINTAGHGSVEIAKRLRGSEPSQTLKAVMYKGNYFSLTTKAPFSRLIYPVPEQAGLGVHLTLDLAGRARFGPDVEPVSSTEDYRVDPIRSNSFYAAIRRYWKALPDDALVPDYSGIRPRVSIDGELYPDFHIEGPIEHGLPGLVNLLGIESPGLTASLAIADAVAGKL